MIVDILLLSKLHLIEMRYSKRINSNVIRVAVAYLNRLTYKPHEIYIKRLHYRGAWFDIPVPLDELFLCYITPHYRPHPTHYISALGGIGVEFVGLSSTIFHFLPS